MSVPNWNQATQLIYSGRLLSCINRGTLHGIRNQCYYTVNAANRKVETDDASTQKDVKPFEAIPGPRGLPFMGTLYKYLPGGSYYGEDRSKAEEKKFAQYGSIVKEEMLPGNYFVHLFNPEDIEVVYRNEGKYPSRGNLMYPLMKYKQDRGKPMDVFLSEKEDWHKKRSLLGQELMTRKATTSYFCEQDSAANDLVKLLRLKRDANFHVADILNEFNKYTIEAMGIVVFDQRLGMIQENIPEESDTGKFFEAIKTFFEVLHKVTFFWPLHKSGKTKEWKKFEKSLDYIFEFGTKYVQSTLDRSSNENLTEYTETSLMKRLQARGAQEDFLVDACVGLLQGGVDTTTSALIFLLYHLATNPEKQEKLFQEINPLLDDKEAPLTEENMSKMNYLWACMKESYRINPVTLGGLRVLEKDILIQGYNIPAGTALMMHHSVLSRRPDLFKDQDKYIPERWMRGDENRENIHPFSVLPFSYGPRNCAGKRLAEQEMRLAIARMIKNFKVEFEGPPLKTKYNMIHVPASEMTFKFTDRSS